LRPTKRGEIAIGSKIKANWPLWLRFLPGGQTDIQNAWNDKQNLAFKKMACAYVYDGVVDTSKAALGMGISRNFSVGIS
jgi:hypothetical protein